MFDLKFKGIWFALVAVIGVSVGVLAPKPVLAAGDAPTTQRTIVGERYVPSIWVDPDGCEHWVMDDGAEGYMTPNVTPDGIPVCRRGRVCAVMETDQFFATDDFRINSAGQQRIQGFFQSATASSFIITGHTDSRASDAYNLQLSKNRANSVARIAKGVGANVIEIRGYGERQPRASNDTVAGMSQNRRVEIICVR